MHYTPNDKLTHKELASINNLGPKLPPKKNRCLHRENGKQCQFVAKIDYCPIHKPKVSKPPTPIKIVYEQFQTDEEWYASDKYKKMRDTSLRGKK